MSGSRIYTKLGDDGSTGLLYGGRTSKADSLMEAIGSIDETVATLGLARVHATDDALAAIILGVQRDLFVAAADLVTNPHARDRLVAGISLLTPAMVTHLEALIDQRMAAKPLRPVFVVPGANLASVALDMARTQVRRAERRLVAHARSPQAGAPGAVNPQVGIYLNRVSDLLYVLARQAAGDAEEPASHAGVARD
ncbi:MAG TPA: cob(I)yrinic acid a,c-diamide adenosyltransferase [Ottowia sp.]|uniref:cob(I)yrinic acid a,c-diamide adenosyltransferase n=1 Tax=Ottowia sp. TaxID=1898956 RepID=UPI002BE36F87|nr:cob(I)yrinic acid a,c-diamide adenosyltransferase [Ottowia sp.]HMN21183.1 cob(I)yrinic acid a,c-diamide adenosyltransferase [Ottowia sp.]